MEFVNKPPDTETRDDIERTMGEIWEAADPVNQSKTDRHQGKGKTIDNAVNQDIHRQRLE
jgi:hypothetical protein